MTITVYENEKMIFKGQAKDYNPKKRIFIKKLNKPQNK